MRYSAHSIYANEPLRTGGLTGWDFHIKVPRGASLFKENALSLLLNPRKNNDYVAIYDITKYISAGIFFKYDLKVFFEKYVNNFYSGELVIWQNGVKSEYDVPHDLFFDDKRMFTGRELVEAGSYSGFVNNFEFHHYI